MLDPSERAKYDANQTRNAYAGYNGRTSGMKGNPWSNVSSQYPPPPKPPPRAPPPSAGAQRYGKFEMPRSAGGAKEGASARTDTFKAWESMRAQSRPKTSERPEPPKRPAGTGRTFVSPKTKDSTHSARTKDDGYKFAVPPRPRHETPGTSTPKRDTSVKGFKGFKPTAPGDEQPAPRGAYSTQRTHPPEPPPRMRPESADEANHVHPSKRASVTADILEGRTSTPYSMQGGEKFNPFAANLNRAKSQRVQSDTERPIPRTESDPNMATPRKHRPSPQTHQYTFPTCDDETSSSDESIGISIPHSRRNRTFANGRGPAAAEPGSSSSDARGTAQKYFGENPLNAADHAIPKAKEAENMYAAFANRSVPSFAAASNHTKPTVSSAGQKTSNPFEFPPTTAENLRKYPNLFSPDFVAPSGVPVGGSDTEDEWLAKNRAPSSTLNPIETTMRNLVDRLVISKNGSAQKTDSSQSGRHRPPPTSESPSKKPRLGRKMTPCTCHGRVVFLNFDDDHICDANETSFSMNVDSDTFSTTRPPNLTSRSTDSINTKFTPEDWHGQFTAGDYFKPDQNSMGGVRTRRTQSGSRARAKSPIKVRYVDPQMRSAPQEHEIPMTPGGTKFSAEEWRETFRPQTFAPPPPPAMAARTTKKPKGPSVRATMGTAAVVEDGSSDDTKPLFGKKPPTPASSPDAMDIDTPNPPTPVNAAPPNANFHVNTNPAPKRPVPTPSGTEEELKVDMEDLTVKDVLSTHDLPKPPRGPILPTALSTSTTATPLTATSPTDQHPQPTFFSRPPSATSNATTKVLKESYIQAFTSYMSEWDLFSNRMMLHLVARKNQNDKLANQRWDDTNLNWYRHWVKVDKAVLSHWNECLEKHATVLREWAVFREREKREALVAAQLQAGVSNVQAGVAGLGIGVKDGEHGSAGAATAGQNADRQRPARKRTH